MYAVRYNNLYHSIAINSACRNATELVIKTFYCRWQTSLLFYINLINYSIVYNIHGTLL